MTSVVVVAGATGALGQTIVKSFLNDGARVVATYRDKARFDAVARSVGEAATRLEGHPVDVTDGEAVRELIDDAVRRLGPVDALVNSVGGYSGGKNVWSLDRATLQNMLSLNLLSIHALCAAVVPSMLQAGRGAVVNIASKAALDFPAGASAYAASKAAGLAMMQSLAAELAGTGVRANSVVPNIIDTEENRRAMPKANFALWTPPAQIARLVRFLCSEDAQSIHGAAIPIYGHR